MSLMNNTPDQLSRREFLKSSSRVAAASALAGVALPYVHAASGDTINFSVTGTITLTSAQISINKDLTITGPGVAISPSAATTTGASFRSALAAR